MSSNVMPALQDALNRAALIEQLLDAVRDVMADPLTWQAILGYRPDRGTQIEQLLAQLDSTPPAPQLAELTITTTPTKSRAKPTTAKKKAAAPAKRPRKKASSA